MICSCTHRTIPNPIASERLPLADDGRRCSDPQPKLGEEIARILDLHPYPSLGGQGTLWKKKKKNCKAQRDQGYQKIMTHRIS